MYRRIEGVFGPVIQSVASGGFIPDDPANSDYQEYLEWVAAGNEPTAAQ